MRGAGSRRVALLPHDARNVGRQGRVEPGDLLLSVAALRCGGVALRRRCVAAALRCGGVALQRRGVAAALRCGGLALRAAGRRGGFGAMHEHVVPPPDAAAEGRTPSLGLALVLGRFWASAMAALRAAATSSPRSAQPSTVSQRCGPAAAGVAAATTSRRASASMPSASRPRIALRASNIGSPGRSRSGTWRAFSIVPIMPTMPPARAKNPPPPCLTAAPTTPRSVWRASSPVGWRDCSSSGSPRKCPSIRGQVAYRNAGPFPLRTRPRSAPAVSCTSSTSVPSTRSTARPNACARSARSPPVTVPAAVVMAQPLSMQTTRSGNDQPTARLRVSSAMPWFIAPSPTKLTPTACGRSVRAASAKPAPTGIEAPTIPELAAR